MGAGSGRLVAQHNRGSAHGIDTSSFALRYTPLALGLSNIVVALAMEPCNSVLACVTVLRA